MSPLPGGAAEQGAKREPLEVRKLELEVKDLETSELLKSPFWFALIAAVVAVVGMMLEMSSAAAARSEKAAAKKESREAQEDLDTAIKETEAAIEKSGQERNELLNRIEALPVGPGIDKVALKRTLEATSKPISELNLKRFQVRRRQ